MAVLRRRALVAGVGIDLVDLEEFRAGLTDDGVELLCLPDEIAYARTQARPWENLGARQAAKRAVFRALGAEVGEEPAWHDVEVLRSESGELDVRLTGTALALAERRGVSGCSISMTHTRGVALAVAVLEDGSDRQHHATPEGDSLGQHR